MLSIGLRRFKKWLIRDLSHLFIVELEEGVFLASWKWQEEFSTNPGIVVILNNLHMI